MLLTIVFKSVATEQYFSSVLFYAVKGGSNY